MNGRAPRSACQKWLTPRESCRKIHLEFLGEDVHLVPIQIFASATTNSIKLGFDESSRTSMTGLSVLLRNAMFISTLMDPAGPILEGGIGFEYARDLRSDLTSGMARHSLYLRRTFTNVRE